MAAYASKDELVMVMSTLWDRILVRADIMDNLAKAKIVIRFRYTDMDAALYLDAQSNPARYYWDPTDNPPFDVEMIFSSETNHLFWMESLNIPLAIASRKVIAKGSVQEALKLIPALKPAFPIYPEVLRDLGKSDLLERAVTPKRRLRLPRIRIPRRRAYDLNQIPTFPWPEDSPSATTENAAGVDPGEISTMDMFRVMYRIRMSEQHLSEAFAQGDLPTESIHLSIGQESVAAGVCLNLRDTDYLNTTHRGHGHIIAKGADLRQFMAELYGKSSGSCGGKGGSMHVTDRSCGILGANGIVGAGFLLGLGAGFSIKQTGRDDVSVVFAGDGSINQGMFHEAANFIGLFELPVLIVIENNLYGEFTHIDRHSAVTDIAERAKAYRIAAERIDGSDVQTVYTTTRRILAAMRADGQPRLLEVMTYRHHGHMEGDPQSYRSDEERQHYREKDPIARLEASLLQQDDCDETAIADLKRSVDAEIEDAVNYAIDAPLPDTKVLLQNTYAPEEASTFNGSMDTTSFSTSMRDVSVSQAINEAIAEEMDRDNSVFLWGEDVTLGGYFNVTDGLVDRFGPNRIIDTPISENAIVGGAVGAAMTGMRPIAEILFADFLSCCMDPLLNQAAKLHYMTGGQVAVPLVVRTPLGSGIGMAAQHSQSMEKFFFGVPGIMVIAPCDAFTAKGLLKAAIRCNNPVLFFEHKLLYANAGPVPDTDYVLPIGKARIVCEGTDVTIVSHSLGVGASIDAAKLLRESGISAEVVDLATLYPMDTQTILDSVKKTGRLVTIEEGTCTGGIGAEVIARVTTAGHNLLRTAPIRIAAPECPVPYARNLEQTMLPNPETITKTIIALIDR